MWEVSLNQCVSEIHNSYKRMHGNCNQVDVTKHNVNYKGIIQHSLWCFVACNEI